MPVLSVKAIAFLAVGILAVDTTCCATPTEDDLIARARSMLAADGVAPATRKVSVSYFARSGDYFRDKPRDGYWDAGRSAVGHRANYGVHYSPKQLMLGGVGTYLFDAKSHKFLWAYKGK